MFIEQIIAIASDVYGDNLVLQHYLDPDGGPGDTLAKFIAIELVKTFDKDANDAEQLHEAMRVMEVGRKNIESVENAFGFRAMRVLCERLAERE